MTEPTLAPPRSDEVLPPGTRLGPYEIEGLIGSGGMGHVYRARDPRLGRRVAIKTLAESAAAAGSEGIRRFETEARAAGSLDHPNLLIVYDVGSEGNISYIVSELLEGETLRDRLGRGGALPEKQVIDIALQAARGLAAAHARGIVHRDLKPENLFLTRDRGVKILDFGVAKLIPTPEHRSDAVTGQPMTVVGMVVGTVGYMAPEQVNGEVVDPRADLFSLGVVMHEMLRGSAPFRRATPVASMNAIATEDAPELPESVSPGLATVVFRCLEKLREDRFQSANDVIVALDLLAATAISGASTARQRALSGAKTSRRQVLRVGMIAAGAGLAAGIGGGVLLDRVLRPEALPASFRRLTFRRGLIRSARFAPDGQTILYGALWDGGRCRVHGVRLDGPESSVLDLPDANLLAVSRSGELALSLGSHLSGVITTGTLARAPMTGGVPRELIERVKFADWSPDGANLAVIRRVDGRDLLEYPSGKVLVHAPAGEGGALGFARVSPDGKRVAYVQYRSANSLSGKVCLVDIHGNSTALTGEYLHVHGLAWKGDEIWFTAADQAPLFRAVCSVKPGSAPRVLRNMPGNVTLWDISRDGGNLVLAHTDDRAAMFVQRGKEPARDMSWLDSSMPADISRDGRLLLFNEYGQGGGADGSVYLRGTDGSPAVRLAAGRALALSPDTKWALCAPAYAASTYMELVPTGAGQTRRIAVDGLTISSARFLLDGKQVVVEATESGQRQRVYLFDLEAGSRRALTPEGVWNWALSPDGLTLAARGPDPVTRLYSVETGESRELSGESAGESLIGWIETGVLVMRPNDASAAPGAVWRVDVESGERKAFSNILPSDGAGLMTLSEYCATPDGGTQAYSWHRALSNLYLAQGLG